ncbi:transposase [Aliarcobacter cryaerophilus]|uniref:transposase n=1 Tax=Aliarcobacter cryaerophilus TaxID=28198 RepID=UPI003DA2F73C
MARREYSEEFRRDAVKQVIENGYGIIETAERLGVHHDSLRNWIKRYQSPETINKLNITDNANLEIKRLQKELKRVTEERDILKKAAAYFANNPN